VSVGKNVRLDGHVVAHNALDGKPAAFDFRLYRFDGHTL
jgi:hypothetical protein